MKRAALRVAALLGLSVLPARSADPPLSIDTETHTLTLIDAVPTKDQILKFAPDPAPHLRELALCGEDSDREMSPVRHRGARRGPLRRA